MRAGWVLVVVAGVLAGCGAKTLQHTVKPGENLYRIGLAYGVTHQELARANDLRNPDRIEIGQVIRIPGASRQLPVNTITPVRARDDRPPAKEIPAGPKAFAWPVKGATLASRFGPRGATHHDGIDLAAPVGTPVQAARAGRVLYSDRLRGYGNIVILEHEGGWATVYAHHQENLVQAGEVVRQGDVVGRVGETGQTTGPNLHFEIRKDNVARNPLFFLPQGRAVAGRSPTQAEGGPDA
ncbi:MAG: peptidoglycan DD-metalloendopeptidase family protein [bacterium]|nr:peptidoglycan DD-metalloendopeptidase family protein [bacterium]